MSDQRKVKVMTTVPNGIELSLRENGRNSRYPGLRVQVPGSRTVQVGGEFALVDEGFMKAWLEQNENSQIVKSGALVIVAEDAPPPVDNVEQQEPETTGAEGRSVPEGDGGLHHGAEEGETSGSGGAPALTLSAPKIIEGDAGDAPKQDGNEQPTKEPVQDAPESDKPVDAKEHGAEEGEAS